MQREGREPTRAAARPLLEGNFPRELTALEKLLGGQSNVFDDPAEKNRRDVTTAVDWNSSLAAVWMTELLVGTPLPDLLEAEGVEDRDYLPGLQNRQPSHRITPSRFASP